MRKHLDKFEMNLKSIFKYSKNNPTLLDKFLYSQIWINFEKVMSS